MNELIPRPNLPYPGPVRTGAGWGGAPGACARCTAWTYVANAAIHPANLFVLVGTILLIASRWSVLALILGLNHRPRLSNNITPPRDLPPSG